MNIAVVAKQVPDLVEGLEIDASGKAIDPGSVRHILSESDDHALEEALLIKERVGGRVEVFSLNVGEVKENLLMALAKGADRAVLVNAGLETIPDNHTVAQIFAPLVRDSTFDLILTGVRAIDDLDGSLGGLLAGYLDLPYVGLIRKVEVPAAAGAVVVEKEFPGGCAAELGVQLPAVLGIQAAEQPPRYIPISRLRLIMKTAKVEELFVSAPNAQPLGIERLFKPEEGTGATMLSGNPEDLAQQIFNLLIERRLVR
ncbi:MAG: electron transfer flavoprotein subunit beta/FixA family protein [Terriglobia bacterium]